MFQGGASFFAWRRYEEGAITNIGTSYESDFSGVVTDVGDGYGYGGDSDGNFTINNLAFYLNTFLSFCSNSLKGSDRIGAVGTTNASYQASVGIPAAVPVQNPNPFVGTEGYGY
uniref:Peptidase A1 domain-containing protein n=1 Tax=Heterorhabditis bacteriophora TaxID=37862 RepID=A0A1I7WVN3_HETBA